MNTRTFDLGSGILRAQVYSDSKRKGRLMKGLNNKGVRRMTNKERQERQDRRRSKKRGRMISLSLATSPRVGDGSEISVKGPDGHFAGTLVTRADDVLLVSVSGLQVDTGGWASIQPGAEASITFVISSECEEYLRAEAIIRSRETRSGKESRVMEREGWR